VERLEVGEDYPIDSDYQWWRCGWEGVKRGGREVRKKSG